MIVIKYLVQHLSRLGDGRPDADCDRLSESVRELVGLFPVHPLCKVSELEGRMNEYGTVTMVICGQDAGCSQNQFENFRK